jgi:hypothetical protein
MSSSPRPAARRLSLPARPPDLGTLSDQALLATRLCVLGLRLPGTELAARATFLDRELARHEIAFRPHLWLSTDWFSPDDVPGFAIPFYLAHPRLRRLEARQMRSVEGGTPRSFLQLMRHETGHALDSAYRLHETAEWRALFGPFDAPYRDRYEARPYSKRFVKHLQHGYAQSHPAEDFAETFAVWLDPVSRWRTRYRGWPALEKLAYVDRTMHTIARQAPLVRGRELVEPLAQLTLTLGEYYEDKRRRYRPNRRVYERDLKRLFREQPNGRAALPAAVYLRDAAPEIRKLVAERTGAFQYDIDRLLRRMIQRSNDLELVVTPGNTQPDERHARRVAAQLTRYLAQGHHRFVR